MPGFLLIYPAKGTGVAALHHTMVAQGNGSGPYKMSSPNWERENKSKKKRARDATCKRVCSVFPVFVPFPDPPLEVYAPFVKPYDQKKRGREGGSPNEKTRPR